MGIYDSLVYHEFIINRSDEQMEVSKVKKYKKNWCIC